jgi:diguanylate cyclase (GGDEF)-like protein
VEPDLRATEGVPVLVVTMRDEDVAYANAALHDCGNAARCTMVSRAEDIEAELAGTAPDLMLVFTDQPGIDLETATQLGSRIAPGMPVISVATTLDESRISEALRAGASDAVSTTERERFQAVVGRELRGTRLENALDDVLGSASQYKKQLQTLMKGASEAIAVVQEGIIVSCNPAWTDLLGIETEDEGLSLPVMDFCSDDDQPALKGAIVACLKKRWDGESLRMHARRCDGTDLRLNMSLECVEFEGDAAVRLVVANSKDPGSDVAEEATHAASTDTLTGLYGRTAFIEKLTERLDTPLKGGVRALLVLRPDRFSQVSDSVGLLGSEQVLGDIGHRIADAAQPSDLCARFGGTQFAMLLERGTMCDVESWAEHLMKGLRETIFEHDGRSTTVTCTMGLAEAEFGTGDPVSLLEQTEAACQQGRAVGGNRIEFSVATSESRRIRVADAAWVPRIRAAMMQDRLQLSHQPVASLLDEQDGIFDTFVRMIDEEGNTVLPSEFMPAAERAGLAKNVDRWVVNASLEFCAQDEPSLVFIRLSQESALDKSFLKWLDTQVAQSGAQPEQLCFQLAEHVVVRHVAQVKNLANALVERGCMFAVERAGRGPDTIQLLAHVPMQFIKIDGALMQGLARDKDTQDPVSAITREARAHDVKTVAERIEDANTMAVLWQLGIAYIQGHYVEMSNVVLEDDEPVLALEPEPPMAAESTA